MILVHILGVLGGEGGGEGVEGGEEEQVGGGCHAAAAGQPAAPGTPAHITSICLYILPRPRLVSTCY